ncbi:MAG: LysM peptidoglycan-binding domain-containing protein [Pseudomonadota bacterium]
MRTVLILLLLLAAGALIYVFNSKKSEEAPAPEPELVEQPVEAPVDDVADETLSLPRFDIVRVDRSGFAVIAGRAEPGATVELLANGELLSSEAAGGDGAWAINTDTPLSTGPVELGLRMVTKEGLTITSGETIIIYVPEREGDQPIVLRTTPGGATEVLQRASDPVGDLGPLAIETIDYDDEGNVIFTGRAEPGSVVQVFANRSPVDQVNADERGRWELATRMPPGRYTLQIVQLGKDGAPKYAIEVPFEQASFDEILLRDGNVIVQPGNNLWVISRTVYGTGEQYTVIYAANADQIRDPDLIYPGQVFRLPDSGEETP